MIAQVSLKGFQSHVDSVFNLGKGLNVVTGPSDAGKTAIIRAIRWVAFNEPQGEAFVNEKVGEAEVKIYLENNFIITKTRRKGKTSYLLQENESDEGSLFEKSEVPEEVKRLLGIEKHSFGDFESALNFSFQLDAPFLISETASAGAKVLGKLAGTESVDLAIKGVSKDTYAARQLRTQAEKDMERITGSLFEYEGIDDAKKMLETAEMLLEQVEASKEKLDSIKGYDLIYHEVADRLEDVLEKLNRLAHVPELDEDLKNIEKAQQRYDQLLQLNSDCHRLQDRINTLSQDIRKFEELPGATQLLDAISHDEERLYLINSLRQSYQKYTDDVKRTSETLETVKDIDVAAEVLNRLENDTNKIGTLYYLDASHFDLYQQAEDVDGQLSRFNHLSTAEEYLNSLASDVERFTGLKELHKSLLVSDQVLVSAEAHLNQAKDDLQNEQNALQEAWDEAGGTCPLCEQPMNESHKH